MIDQKINRLLEKSKKITYMGFFQGRVDSWHLDDDGKIYDESMTTSLIYSSKEKIVFMSTTNKSYYCRPHIHSCGEYIYVVSGQIHRVETDEIIKPFSVYYIEPEEIHSFVFEPNTKIFISFIHKGKMKLL